MIGSVQPRCKASSLVGLRRLPSPFTEADRGAGYRYEMAFRQFEVSDTCVFDRPQAGRMWFEGVIRDHLDVGRPDQIALIFHRRVNSSYSRKVSYPSHQPEESIPRCAVTTSLRGSSSTSKRDGRCVPRQSSVIPMTSASVAASARRTGMPFGPLANPPTGVYVTPKRQTRSPLPTWPPFAR